MSAFFFSPYKIAEMAMKVEEAGAVFYEILANSVDDRELRSTFMGLSSAELKHRDKFREIAQTFNQEDYNEYAVDVSALIQPHLDNLRSAAFNLRRQPSDMSAALAVAINIEDESIRIYTEIRTIFIEKFHPVLSAIIEEEKKHLKMLTAIKLQSV